MEDIAQFKDYRHEVILIRDFKPRRTLMYVISGHTMTNGKIELIHKYHVYDKYNKLINTSDHLQLALSVYNEIK